MKFVVVFLFIWWGISSSKIRVINFSKDGQTRQSEVVEAFVTKVRVEKLAVCVQFKLFYRHHKVMPY